MYSRALFKVLPPPVAVIMLFYAFLQLAGASHPCDRSPLSVIDECGQLMVLSDLRPAAEFANRMVATLPTCVDSFQCAGIVAFTAGELNTAINMFSKVMPSCASSLRNCLVSHCRLCHSSNDSNVLPGCGAFPILANRPCKPRTCPSKCWVPGVRTR